MKKDFTFMFLYHIQTEMMAKYGLTSKQANLPIETVRNRLLELNDDIQEIDMKIHPGTMGYDETFTRSLILDLENINKKGFQIASSVSEVLYKVNSIMTVKNLDPIKIYFRGQDNQNNYLNSSLSRKKYSKEDMEFFEESKYLRKIEVTQLKEFIDGVRKNNGRFKNHRNQILNQYTTLPEIDSSHWWAIKQHYDGGTRLIDVTTSVLVALYFCCAKFNTENIEIAEPESHGKLFMIQADDTLGTFDRKTYIEFFDQSKKEKPIIYESTLPYARPSKQKSFFMIDYNLEEKYPVHNGFTILIDKEAKIKILKELDVRGINRHTIEEGWGNR